MGRAACRASSASTRLSVTHTRGVRHTHTHTHRGYRRVRDKRGMDVHTRTGGTGGSETSVEWTDTHRHGGYRRVRDKHGMVRHTHTGGTGGSETSVEWTDTHTQGVQAGQRQAWNGRTHTHTHTHTGYRRVRDKRGMDGHTHGVRHTRTGGTGGSETSVEWTGRTHANQRQVWHGYTITHSRQRYDWHRPTCTHARMSEVNTAHTRTLEASKISTQRTHAYTCAHACGKTVCSCCSPQLTIRQNICQLRLEY